jgi:tripartite-type tricarboxylate transporter receptor subunit TctC
MFSRIIVGLLFCISAWAQPIKIVVPFQPGGQVDINAREAEKLITQELKRPVVVEYKLGAGGSVGVASVAHNKTNEITLMIIDTNVLANVMILENLNTTDFRFLNLLGTTSPALIMSKNSTIGNIKNWKNIKRPITIGTNGYGGSHHYYTYMLGKSMDIEFIVVPYKGIGSAINDLIGGNIDAMWGGITTFTPYEQSGKVEIIASLGTRRSPFAQHVPTFTELGLNAGPSTHWILLSNTTADSETLRQISELFQQLPNNSEFYTKTNMLPEKGSIDVLLKARIQEQREFAEIVKVTKVKQ